MKKLLAFDFGEKRTGIAVTDDLQIIASGLTTIATKELISFVSNFLNENSVERFIIGLPKQMDNSDSESMPYVLNSIQLLEKNFPQIAIEKIDERFTSKMAFQTMIDSGLSKKQRKNKALVDEISATIILQSYLYFK
jgi:putative Holliday junction resolvase